MENLALGNIETISSNERHNMIRQDREDMIFYQHSVLEIGEFHSEFQNSLGLKWEQTKDISLEIVWAIHRQCQENSEYVVFCESSPTMEIQSFSKYEYFYILCTNLFDNDHLQKNPPIYHAIEPLHLSFKDKTLSDEEE